jgi:hypothetical protein
MSNHKHFNDGTQLPDDLAKGAQTKAVIVAAVGLGLTLAGGLFGLGGQADANSKQFFFSWLTSFAFYTTIGLGALFFVILHHLVRASWSTGIRRIAENLAINLPLMALFAIPVAAGLYQVFHWAHFDHEVHANPAFASTDPILAAKHGYLNVKAFAIRAVIFFGLWTAIIVFFRSKSVAQDASGDHALTFKMRQFAPLSMLTFALSSTFFAFDWLMSLDPHWFSTMFGVYIFAGSVISFFASTILVVLWLTKNGVLSNTLTVGNFHDAGKLMFGFIVFWTYVSFSQYFLIWYANIPEETAWYLHRSQGGWQYVGTAVVFGHFIVPFWMLMSRHIKRNRTLLGVGATWMLLMHFVDLYYVVMPTLHHHFHPHWLDITAFVGMGGVFVAAFIFWCRKSAVIAHKDPQLEASMGYDNV